MALRVFISYSTEDRSTVDFVASILAGASVELYVADYSLPAGAPLSEAIVAAIKNCDLFIVLWSVNSHSSHWVSQEIGIARGENKQIIPVVLNSNLKPPAFIANLKYLDVPRNPEAAFTWLRDNVIARATEKQKKETLAWFAVGSAILWILSQK